MTQSVHELKQTARKKIINLNLAEDQALTLARWVDTFLHNTPVSAGQEADSTQHNKACQIMQLVLAGMAAGEFLVKTNKDFHEPTMTLQLSDYISHASRVLLDLSELSEENKLTLKNLLDLNGTYSRPSTHLIKKTAAGDFIEKKSSTHGVFEYAKGKLHTIGESTRINSLVKGTVLEGPALTDFGLNIQMGGFNQPNLSGGFSQFGLDGHVLIHQEPDFGGLLIGLEQSGPYESLKNSLPEEDDNSVGLSGMHSKTGASDDYTAAGSLYFSNLIYKLKLFCETGTLTPIKYDGMKVKITDANFSEVMATFNSLNASRNRDELSQLLGARPNSAKDGYWSALEFIAQIETKDIDALLTQLNAVDLLNAPDKALLKVFKKQISAIKSLMNDQEPNYQSIHEPPLATDNPHLQNLAQVIERALQQIHQEYIVEALNTLLENDKKFKNAQKIYQTHLRYTLKNPRVLKFNEAYMAYFELKSALETYADNKSQNLTEGFKLCFQLKKALENLNTVMATKEAQMLLDMSNQIVDLNLEIRRINTLLQAMESQTEDASVVDANNEATRLLQNEIEHLEHEKEELIDRLNHSIEGTARLQSEKTALELQLKQIHDQLTPASKRPSFLIRLSQSIFDLDNLGFLSAAICVGLVTSILMPHMPITLLLGLAAGAALTSVFCFFMTSNSKEPTFSPIPQQELTPF